jgi:hypothetical protein
MKIRFLMLLMCSSLLSFTADAASADEPNEEVRYLCQITGQVDWAPGSKMPECMTVGPDCNKWEIRCKYTCYIKQNHFSKCPEGQSPSSYPSCSDALGLAPLSTIFTSMLEYNDVVHYHDQIKFNDQKTCNEYLAFMNFTCPHPSEDAIQRLGEKRCIPRMVVVSSSCRDTHEPKLVENPELAAHPSYTPGAKRGPIS